MEIVKTDKVKVKLNVGQMQLQETGRNSWLCRPGDDVSKDDLLKPIFWTHVAKKLRAGDKVAVLSHDAGWYAEMIVRASGPLEALMGMISFVEFQAAVEPTEDEYTVKWAGGAKWRVTRSADNAVLKDGFASEAAARAWISLPLAERAAA